MAEKIVEEILIKSDFKECDSDGTCSKRSPVLLNVLKDFHKKISKSKTDGVSSPDQLVNDIVKILGLKSESCIYSHHKFVEYATENNLDRDQILDYIDGIFYPIGPRESNKWLSNDNIDKYLDKLAKKFPDFQNFPYQMIDFNEQKNNIIANVNLTQYLDRGKRRFGMVLNTDVSSGSGIHWFPIFIDCSNSDKCTIEYFNSTGDTPDKRIIPWLVKIQHQLSTKMLIPVEIILSNNPEYQRGNSECGVFSLVYILLRLNKVPWEFFRDKKMYKNTALRLINDKNMISMRKKLFREC